LRYSGGIWRLFAAPDAYGATKESDICGVHKTIGLFVIPIIAIIPCACISN
jgi:hypothetical protein